MSGFSKDSDANARSGHDRSLQVLLVALAVTGTIATSMIVIAYATSAGGHVSPDGIGTTSAAESEPEEEEAGRAEVVDDRPLQPDKQGGGFAEYIDSLLANGPNYEKNGPSQAQLADAATSDAPESGPADESAADGTPPEPANEQTASEPDDTSEPEGDEKADDKDDSSRPSDDEQADGEETVLQAFTEMLTQLS